MPVWGRGEHAAGCAWGGPAQPVPCWKCQAFTVHAATHLELLPGRDAAGSPSCEEDDGKSTRTEALGCVETSALRMGEGERGQALGDGKAQPGSSLEDLALTGPVWGVQCDSGQAVGLPHLQGSGGPSPRRPPFLPGLPLCFLQNRSVSRRPHCLRTQVPGTLG